MPICFSLIKDKNKRPKYHELQDSLFIRKYERLTSNEAREWFIEAIRQAENLAANRSTPRYVAWLVASFFLSFCCYSMLRMV